MHSREEEEIHYKNREKGREGKGREGKGREGRKGTCDPMTAELGSKGSKGRGGGGGGWESIAYATLHQHVYLFVYLFICLLN